MNGAGIVGSVVAFTLVLGAPGAALAAPGDAVTLVAVPATVTFGESVALSGQIAPPAPGETVEVVDAAGVILASAVTDASGAYTTSFAPDRNLAAHARWGSATSAPVALSVRPVVEVTLGRTWLFGPATITGRVLPAHAGPVTVVLERKGRGAASLAAGLDAQGRFRAKLPVARLGAHRAVVQVADGTTLGATSRSNVRMPPTPKLRAGSRGKAVRYLERRLRDLSYHLLGINRRYDFRTGDAVLAFHKVQGMPRTKDVTRATWKRLTKPRIPKPRATTPKLHIEIDKSKQVLYVVKGGEIWRIVHTSTGRSPGWTRDGVWRVHRKIAGYSPGRLWHPSYFDGNRAVHGWPSVPAYPASHGCARVPNWTAVWLHGLMGYGTVVRVYA